MQLQTYVNERIARIKTGMQSRKNIAAAPVVSAVLVSAAVFLALYALGVFSGGAVTYVDNLEYSSGGFAFSGGLVDGQFNGAGTIGLAGGSVFKGEFDEGRFSGDGAFYYSGDIHSDDWHFNGLFQNGRAGGGIFYFDEEHEVVFSRDSTEVFLSGPDWQYRGGFNERGPNGVGTFVFADGSVYRGGFLNGLAHGDGQYMCEDGKLIYSGEFSDGSFDGRGFYFSTEGWVYEGGFKDGLFNGEGRITDGHRVNKGRWALGVQIRRNE